jgi:hypothetical protein
MYMKMYTNSKLERLPWTRNSKLKPLTQPQRVATLAADLL